jgi:hypothetical protein
MSEREEAATVQLKVRMKEPLRANLEEAARRRGVSMNAETVHRLERSFEQDQRIEDVFGNRDLFGLLRAVAAVMDAAGEVACIMFSRRNEASRGWLDSPYAYDQAMQAAVRTLDMFRPPGEIKPGRLPKPKPTDSLANANLLRVLAHSQEHIGTDFAELLLGKLKYRGKSFEEAEEMRGKLGRLAERLETEHDK